MSGVDFDSDLEKKNRLLDERERIRRANEAIERDLKMAKEKNRTLKKNNMRTSSPGDKSLFFPIFFTTVFIIILTLTFMIQQSSELKQYLPLSDNLSIYINSSIIIGILTIFNWKRYLSDNTGIDAFDTTILLLIPLLIVINIIHMLFIKDIINIKDVRKFIIKSKIKYIVIPIIIIIYLVMFKFNVIKNGEVLLFLSIITIIFLLLFLNLDYVKQIDGSYLIDAPNLFSYLIPFINFSIFSLLHFREHISLFSAVVGFTVITLSLLIIFNMKNINHALIGDTDKKSFSLNDDEIVFQNYSKSYFSIIYNENNEYLIPIIVIFIIYFITSIITLIYSKK